MKLSRLKQIRRPQETIFQCDVWDRNSFEDMCQEIPELGNLLEAGLKKLPTFYGLLLDTFATLFSGEPRRKAYPPRGLEINKMVIESLWTMPEFQRLRIHVVHRRTECAACVVRFGAAILESIPEPLQAQAQQQFAELGDQPPQPQRDEDSEDETESGGGDSPPSDDDPNDSQSSSGNGDPGSGGQSPGKGPSSESSKAPGSSPQHGGAPGPLENQIAESLRRCRQQLTQKLKEQVQEASQEIKDLGDICTSQGWDLSERIEQSEDSAAAWQACKKLLRSQELREIFRKFGNRLRTMALACQEQKPVGKGFIAIDRSIGNDPEKVPPDELYVLAEPLLQVLAVQALAEGTLIQDECQEEFEREQGDIVALVDISGSTAGPISQFIKGTVLGLQVVAQVQNRNLKVIPFADGPRGVLDLTRPSPKELSEFAEIYANGGTCFTKALHKAIEVVKTGGNEDYPPDIVMITDGQDYIYPDDMAVLSQLLKHMKSRLKVVYIGVPAHQSTTIGQLAGPGNEIFLDTVDDWRKLEQVFEQL